MNALIAILDDEPGRRAAMQSVLEKQLPDVDIVFFDNALDMIEWLPEGLETVQLLSLDHDLGPVRDRGGERFDPGIGRDVVDVLEQREPCCPVIVHSSNGPAADGMLYALQFAGWSAEREYPHNDLAWIESHWIELVAKKLAESD